VAAGDRDSTIRHVRPRKAAPVLILGRGRNAGSGRRPVVRLPENSVRGAVPPRPRVDRSGDGPPRRSRIIGRGRSSMQRLRPRRRAKRRGAPCRQRTWSHGDSRRGLPEAGIRCSPSRRILSSTARPSGPNWRPTRRAVNCSRTHQGGIRNARAGACAIGADHRTSASSTVDHHNFVATALDVIGRSRTFRAGRIPRSRRPMCPISSARRSTS